MMGKAMLQAVADGHGSANAQANRPGKETELTGSASGDLVVGRPHSRRATESFVLQVFRPVRAPKSLWGSGVAMNVVGRLLSVAGLTLSALLSPTINVPLASAVSCPDVEVVFARGTFEPSGIGTTGQAFADALRSKMGGKSVDVYPVNYPASLDFQRAADGVIDAGNRVRDMAVSCQNTKIVLGGYSQGAAVMGYITVDAIPAGFTPPVGITGPLPPWVAEHVAAVALFGKPSSGFLQTIDAAAPPITVGNLYSAKTIDLCVTEDPICSPSGADNGAHGLYAVNGMAGQAADFAARGVTSGVVLTHG